MVSARDMHAAARAAAISLLQRSRRHAAAHARRKRSRAAQLGFAEGYRQGEAKLVQSLVQYQRQYESALRNLEHDALQLAMKTAKQVLQTELSTQPGKIIPRIRLAISELTEQRALRVAFHPMDASRLDATEGLPGIQIDASVDKGTARIDTVAGSLFIDWRQMLQGVQDELTKRLSALLKGERMHDRMNDGDSTLRS